VVVFFNQKDYIAVGGLAGVFFRSDGRGGDGEGLRHGGETKTRSIYINHAGNGANKLAVSVQRTLVSRGE